MLPRRIRFPNICFFNVSGSRGNHRLGSKREQVPSSGRRTLSLSLTTEVNMTYPDCEVAVGSSSGCHSDPSICWSADFRNRFATLDNLIRSFFDSLLHPTALSGFSGTGGVCTSRQTLLTVNLAASALITRHRPFALSRAPSNRICVDSAIVAVLALNGLEDQKIVNIYVVSTDVVISVR
ncbi:hypothetical protein EV401DRAFT_586280 [Pisolithus croceorrhizus]|nr:hypothetical protein EV401DRAFT_586280 [Pisolithus croceorrhizus]